MGRLEGRKNGGKEAVVVACCQLALEVGDKIGNVERSCAAIGRAADVGARLVVLPELCSSGYVFKGRAEAYDLAEEVPGGGTTRAWESLARDRKIYVVGGIAEREGVRLFNSAVLIGPEGYIGKYRKMHLWYEEKLFFEPGDLGFPVYLTALGRIGMAICYDLWFPESLRLMAVQGADIVCVPTNWVPVPGWKKGQRPMAVYLCLTGAHCNGVFVAAADRVGEEREQLFLGNSVIVDPTGRVLGGPGSSDREELVLAECDLRRARKGKVWNELNDILRDRRTDYYGATLGAPVRVVGG